VNGEFAENGLDDSEVLARLRLARTDGVGPVTFAKLLRRFRTAEAAIDALPGIARARRVRPPSLDEARAERDRIERFGAALIVFGDPAYPRRLAEIADPPPVLIAMGDTELAARPTVAIVGARNASSGGLRLARTFAADLGAAGVAVVSGLARGIDGAAHEASLPTGTIAVVAGGVDVVYPPEHADLQARIAETGFLVSERAPGATPTGRDFPRRNRIVSGLSDAVLVVEASSRSGTLITARLAGEQGRDVFAVPGSPLDPRAEGANRLIRDGAGLASAADDILAALATPGSGRPRFSEAACAADYEDEISTPGALTEQVRARLSHLPTHPDVLARDCGASASAVSGALLDLVLAGEAEEQPGGFTLV